MIIFDCTCQAKNNTYFAAHCLTFFLGLAVHKSESAKYTGKMLNNEKQYEWTRTLNPDSLVTVAMIYEANSDGTIFSLERKTLNQPFLLQPSELNAM